MGLPNGDRKPTVVPSALPKGGLGIINFKIKADALKLASVVSNCSNTDSKSFYLIKYFFGAKLSSIRLEWSFFQDNSSPCA